MSDDEGLVKEILSQASVVAPGGFERLRAAALVGKSPDEQSAIIMAVIKKAQEKIAEDSERANSLWEKVKKEKELKRGTAEKD